MSLLDNQKAWFKTHIAVKYRNGVEYSYDFSGNNEDHNYTYAKEGS